MMKKILPTLLVGLLISSGLGAVALSDTIIEDSNVLSQIETVSISDFSIQDNGDYQTVSLEEGTVLINTPGQPMVPKITKVFTYPAGTKVVNIDVEVKTKELQLDKQIQPAPRAVPLDLDMASEILSLEPAYDSDIYESEQLFPESQYTIRKGVGLKDTEHVIYVTIDLYGQYSPANDMIYLPEEIDIAVDYQLPTTDLFSADEFDLLIITDEGFTSGLQPLVDHKNSIGVRTNMETVQNIVSQYNGRDDAEDIKLFIKDSIETQGIKYVLLAGGRKGQTFDWYVPSRTTNNDDNWEAGYESDLYFSDIYKIVDEEIVFEDWDPNGNDIFAEWSNFVGKKDIIDYYPDVSVGRLPIRYNFEVAPIVEKIIDYETNADPSWFNKGIVVAGDTFPPSRGGQAGWSEGEMETGKTVGYLESIGFTVEKLWLSIPGAWTGPEDVINAISAGAGFVHFAGHSNPASWGNHPPDDTEHVFIDGIRVWDMYKLSNEGEYPIVMLGGCHSAQFNVTMSNLYRGILEYGINGYFFSDPYRFFYFEWVPHDLSSWIVMKQNGGAIACLGNTGLGYGYVNQNADAGLGGWFEPRFFENYINESLDDSVRYYAGPLHDQTITDYINIIGYVNEDQIDRKTIEEQVLLGDPSLRIGGI
jgi:hypothetical protein